MMMKKQIILQKIRTLENDANDARKEDKNISECCKVVDKSYWNGYFDATVNIKSIIKRMNE